MEKCNTCSLRIYWNANFAHGFGCKGWFLRGCCLNLAREPLVTRWPGETGNKAAILFSFTDVSIMDYSLILPKCLFSANKNACVELRQVNFMCVCVFVSEQMGWKWKYKRVNLMIRSTWAIGPKILLRNAFFLSCKESLKLTTTWGGGRPSGCV